MKKTILLLAAVAFGFTSFAQKPTEGNILTEANFSLNQWNNEFSLPSLRVRYFMADDMAIRADLNVGGQSVTNNFLENADGTGGSGEQKITASFYGLRVGIEKHFAGNDKFSPFMVGGIGFGFNSVNEEWTDYNGLIGEYQSGLTATVDEAASVMIIDPASGDPSFRSSTGFQIGAGLGADYWVTNSFYMGMEFGIAYGVTNFKQVNAELNVDGQATQKAVLFAEGSSSGYSDQMFNTGFRVGFILK